MAGHLKYDRTIIAYHGCDAAAAERIFAGEPFKKSQNDYDWLGEGIYFWEYGVDRALKFAEFQRERGKVKRPAIVGAIIQLGQCFDLMDTRYTSELGEAFVDYRRFVRAVGVPMPRNEGKTPDKKLRRRDCAVLNFFSASRSAASCTTRFAVRSSKGGRRSLGAGSARRATCRSPSATPLASSGSSGP